jgi:hypothetical protein
MNIQQIIDAAEQIAVGMGNDAQKSIVIDSDMTAEDLLPLVMSHVYNELALSQNRNAQDLLVAKTITVEPEGNAVSGTLPVEVLTEHLDQAFLPDYPYSAFSPNFQDFQRQKFSNLLCYWTVHNGKFYTTCEPGGSTEGSGSAEDVEIVLMAPATPIMPSAADDEIVMTQNALDKVIYALALAIRGELKLTL